MCRPRDQRAREARVTFILGVALSARQTRCGRALDSARPCPSRGWVPASQPGSEDLHERRERRSACRCAHALACPCSRRYARCAAHHLDDVRLLCSAGLASGDAADTAVDTAAPSAIVIAGKVSAVAFCHASFGHCGCSCAGAGGMPGTLLCSVCACFRAWGRWGLQWVSMGMCCTDGEGWRAC